jgi:hypothetical protein
VAVKRAKVAFIVPALEETNTKLILGLDKRMNEQIVEFRAYSPSQSSRIDLL